MRTKAQSMARDRAIMENECRECEGTGEIFAGFESYFSGGELKDRDLFECCSECEGTGEAKDIDEEIENEFKAVPV